MEERWPETQRKIYMWISSMLKLDLNKDRKARDLLVSMIPEKPLDELVKKIEGKDVVVLGAGPSLERIVIETLEGKTIVAADGATRFLADNSLSPHIIVTDLDGIGETDLYKIPGSPLYVIHAHGDNIGRIKRIVPLLRERAAIIATTQTEPSPPAYNFGGFTDGDRAVFLSYLFGARKIFLEGMDFGEIVGRYSKPFYKKAIKADGRKRAKLRIGESLVTWLKCTGAPIIHPRITAIKCPERWPWE